MATKTELERLAAMANALRPDWPVRSVLTYLTNEHAGRAYADIAVALATVATDPTTITPRRMSEAGPWWTAVTTDREASTVPRAGAPRCPVAAHDHEIAHNCRACRTEWLETGTWPADTRHAQAAPRTHAPDHAERAAGEREDER